MMRMVESLFRKPKINRSNIFARFIPRPNYTLGSHTNSSKKNISLLYENFHSFYIKFNGDLFVNNVAFLIPVFYLYY